MARPLPSTSSLTRRCRRALALCCGLLLLALFGCAESTDKDQRAQDLNRTVMSPFCPGRTLDGCPSPDAAKWRSDIRQWVDEGVANDEIRRRLYGRFPKEDLSGGPSTGVGMWFPVAMVLAAVGLLAFVLRRLSLARKGALAAAATKSANEAAVMDDAALDARLDDEIQRSD